MGDEIRIRCGIQRRRVRAQRGPEILTEHLRIERPYSDYATLSWQLLRTS
jgi:hypothetical protein